MLFFLISFQHMLMSFRVSELQILLGFGGRSKSGRKHELMGRALQLLKCERNYQIRSKIKELYRQRYPRKMASSPTRIATQPSTRAPISAPSLPPLRTHHDHSNSIPIHPDVRLTSLPFYEYIDDLVRPTSLGKTIIVCVQLIFQFRTLYCGYSSYNYRIALTFFKQRNELPVKERLNLPVSLVIIVFIPKYDEILLLKFVYMIGNLSI